MSIGKNTVVQAPTFYENSDGSTYTVVGSLTNDNGIFSGFSASNHIILPNPSTPITSYEICFKFNIANFNDGRVFGNSIHNVHCPQLEAPNGSETKMWFGHPSGSYSWQAINPDFIVTQNTWYWFKAIWNGTKVLISMSTNGYSYNDAGSINTTTCGWVEGLELGYDNDIGAFTGGKIDFKESYTKINGAIAWSGLDAYLQNSRAKIGKNYISTNTFHEI